MEVINVNNVFEKLGFILLFINTSLFIYSYLKNKNKATKYFVIYLLLTFLNLLSSYFIIDIQKALELKKNNLFLSHFYFVFQFVFLSLFYSQLFNKKQIKHQKIISFFVFSILIIQYSIKPSLFYQFNLLEIFITSFPLVIYSIFHLYNSLSKSVRFMYINAGILIYIATSTLIFILGNYISKIDKEIADGVWFLNKVFYVGYLILILIEWKKSLLKTKS